MLFCCNFSYKTLENAVLYFATTQKPTTHRPRVYNRAFEARFYISFRGKMEEACTAHCIFGHVNLIFALLFHDHLKDSVTPFNSKVSSLSLSENRVFFPSMRPPIRLFTYTYLHAHTPHQPPTHTHTHTLHNKSPRRHWDFYGVPFRQVVQRIIKGLESRCTPLGQLGGQCPTFLKVK